MIDKELISAERKKQIEQLYIDAVYYHLTNKGYNDSIAKVYATRVIKTLTKDSND
ncbi:MAG: hypothetical protein QXS02_04410 [Candidatus Thermoplasmatota archaeon]